MVRIVAVLLLHLAVVCCAGPRPTPVPQDFRELKGLDLRVFVCWPTPTRRVFSSRAQLEETLRAMGDHCRIETFRALEGAFLASLDRASVDFQEESLLILEDWYGTGMARAHLVLEPLPGGGLEAAIVWTVPPPPLTPDTRVERFGLAVRRSAVSRIQVIGREGRTEPLELDW